MENRVTGNPVVGWLLGMGAILLGGIGAYACAADAPLLPGRNQGGTQTLPVLAVSEKYFGDAGVRIELVQFLSTTDGINARNVGKLDPHVQLEVDPNTRGIVRMWDYMNACKYIESDLNPRDFIDVSLYRQALTELASEYPSPFWDRLEIRFREWNE
jgi:hypothetical protein